MQQYHMQQYHMQQYHMQQYHMQQYQVHKLVVKQEKPENSVVEHVVDANGRKSMKTPRNKRYRTY
jgi:hypothetical protein